MFMRYIWCHFFGLEVLCFTSLVVCIIDQPYITFMRYIWCNFFFYIRSYLFYFVGGVRYLQCKTARVIVHFTVQLLPVLAIPCVRYCHM